MSDVEEGVPPPADGPSWVALGRAAFLVWARKEKTWPFGPKDIREGFLGQRPGPRASREGERVTSEVIPPISR